MSPTEPDRNDDDIFEREMSKHQRGLVDTCFEEGQYESAISVLDQLRSVKFKPSAPHIRQLLYIALYPPANNSGNGGPEPGPLSPRKAAKQQKSHVLPLATASSSAQRLLILFAHTNSPSSIFRALPSYPATASDSKNIGRDWGDDEEDSYIAREATRIKDCKDCWSVLRPGFILRKRPVTTTSKGKGKKSARDHFEEDDSDDYEGETSTAIAKHAWPVLDCFLHIFERDELSGQDGETRYSPLLLSQIPSPRSGSQARWETDAPLEIVFHCLRQTDERHRAMGARLMTLLVSLTSTVYLDMPKFVTAVVGRLSSSSIDEMSALLSSLAPSTIITRFKIALCQRYITHSSSNRETIPGDSRPKPQPRAHPRAIRSASGNAADDTGSPMKPVEATATPTPITSKHSLPPSSEILRLIEKDLGDQGPSSAVILSYRIKFELLVAYGIAQEKATADKKDAQWPTMLRDGRLVDVVNIAFAPQEGRVYRESLLSIFAAW